MHVSSLAAIGPSLDGRPVDEDAAPHPVTHYGKSKLEGERIVRRWLPDAVIVRPPVVYGPRDTDVFQILKAVARGVVLEIAGGERWFSAIYVEDLVEGLLRCRTCARGCRANLFPGASRAGLLERTGRRRGPHHGTAAADAPRAGRGGAMPSGFARKCGRESHGILAIISREKVAEACCRFWTCDPARAAANFGFEAPTPLAAGLAETLAWYKEAGWLKY